jgi:pseudaminic acid cytidylyltransferase
MPQPRRIAIIPARSGSARIADKNIRPFCGRPLLLRAIDTAKATGLFDEVHVSTDSALYAKLAALADARPPFLRPPALADNRAPLIDVLRLTLARYGEDGRHFDELCLLYATAPLLEANDLIASNATFANNGDYALTLAVARFSSPPDRALRIRDDGMATWSSPDSRHLHSQDCPPAYYDAGAFCWFDPAQLIEGESGPPLAYRPYVLPASKVVDINDEEDFALAEMLYRGRLASAAQPETAVV